MAKNTLAVKIIYGVCFLCLMAALSLSSAFMLVKNKLSSKKTYQGDAQGESEAVSFSELYPFPEDYSEEILSEADTNDGNEDSCLSKYCSFADNITYKTNYYLTVHQPLSPLFKTISNSLLKFSDGIIMNDTSVYVVLPNGYIAECYTYSPSQKAMSGIADLSSWLKENDIPFLSIITPDKSDDSITEFPVGIPHGYTKTLNEYKDFLAKNEISYIEAKPLLLAKNNNLYYWFYKGDHHWNVNAGFEIASEAAEYLNDELSVSTDKDILRSGNFEKITYSNIFLGSFAQKLGDSWKEDFEVIYPTFETSFHIEIPDDKIDKTGEFSETIINKSDLDNTFSYRAFLYGDHPLIHIENKKATNDTKVLVLKYSFANALCPYLSETVKYIDIIDPRHFDGCISTYIEQTKPDAVILCMGVPNSYSDDSLNLR